MPLTNFVPEIVEAILDDALSNGVTLFDIAVDSPAWWVEPTKRRQWQMLHDLREHQIAYKHPCPQRVSSSQVGK